MAKRREKEILYNAFAFSAAKVFDSAEKECVTHNELLTFLPMLTELLDECGVQYNDGDLLQILKLLDTGVAGGVDKVRFCRGLLQLIEDVRPLLLMELHTDGIAYFKCRMDAFGDGACILEQ